MSRQVVITQSLAATDSSELEAPLPLHAAATGIDGCSLPVAVITHLLITMGHCHSWPLGTATVALLAPLALVPALAVRGGAAARSPAAGGIMSIRTLLV